MANRNNGKIINEEAGHTGGEATSKKHDKEFYEDMGQKDEEKRNNNRGS
ncbi:hypothetical protein [Planococcus salinus]|nr:hypothetical protein [Planococcus salinus]